MRLRSTIFLWTLFATGLPLLGLTLVLLAVSEQRYLDEVDRDINARLNALGTEIDNHLAYEREVIRGIAQSAAMQDFLPVARAANDGARHPEFLPLRNQLTQFLLTLQRTVPGLGSLRVLDGQGNTLIKVSGGRASPAIYPSLGSVEYAEEELMDSTFTRSLRQLPMGEISFMQLPQSRWDLLTGQTLTMLTALVPLGDGPRPAAVLAVNTFGEYLDRILRLVPRPPGAELLIVERNMDNARRNGLLLYHDRLETRFSTPKPHEVRLQSLDQAELWEHIQQRPFGVFTTRDGKWRIYYQEYHPYPNQLTGWVLAFAVPGDTLHAPYAGLRQALWLLVLLAFIASALLAVLGARHIAGPILRLREALRDFASNPARRVAVQSQTQEIRELEADFNAMADRLRAAEDERGRAERRAMQQAKLASIGQMAAGIGHEINNPLNNILSLATLIERGLPRAAQDLREDVHDLREEAQRASRIVRGVMNFARQLPPEHRVFRVCPWLRETVERLEPEAMAADVHFDLTSCDPACTAEADADQLQQVLLNLLQNALHATPPGGRIQVSGACEGGRLRVCVRDGGPGMPPEVLARIFDPFFTTKGVGEGTGLGLSISLGIVQYHGGTLSIRNREDASGVEACFEVPLTPASPRITPPEGPTP
ncbi:sensor histidine kinase [Thiofaba sp. EF100]|uniref:sensor histidine kinase n=1 Tax=Thiofaba sp. EF100 TaxID=3121274 RepID=UPI003221976C